MGIVISIESDYASLQCEWLQSAGMKVPTKHAGRFQVQGSAQVIEALQSGDSIGLLDRKFIRQDLETGRLSIACEHVLEGDDGYFLSYPESEKDLPSLQYFREWLCKQC